MDPIGIMDGRSLGGHRTAGRGTGTSREFCGSISRSGESGAGAGSGHGMRLPKILGTAVSPMTHTHLSRSPSALLGTRMSHKERAAASRGSRERDWDWDQLRHIPGLSRGSAGFSRIPGFSRVPPPLQESQTGIPAGAGGGSAPREQEGITSGWSWILGKFLPEKVMKRRNGMPREGVEFPHSRRD